MGGMWEEKNRRRRQVWPFPPGSYFLDFKTLLEEQKGHGKIIPDAYPEIQGVEMVPIEFMTEGFEGGFGVGPLGQNPAAFRSMRTVFPENMPSCLPAKGKKRYSARL